jgi:hypothetical protein
VEVRGFGAEALENMANARSGGVHQEGGLATSMQNISRPLVIGGVIVLLFAAIFLSGTAASSPWMVFFLLSAMLLVFTVSSAWGDEAGTDGAVGRGATAGVLGEKGSGSDAHSAGLRLGGQGPGNDAPQRLPDPLEDGFDLPL